MAVAALERRARFSESRLWELQRAYFEQAGPEAWSSGTVPHYITSNPYLADAYVDVALAFLRDCAMGAGPATVVELGGGSGRFAYHFLRRLEARGETPPLRYVLTDLPEENVARWRSHPWFEPFLRSGRLDVARFDACADDALPGVAGPVVVIANYVFDGLPSDCFAVGEGRLRERLVTLLGDGDPARLGELELSWEDAPVAADRFSDPDERVVLDEYRALPEPGTVVFPTGALRALRTLERIAAGPLLVLAADKGNVAAHELSGREEPHVAAHGSVSLMVNFHALGRWVERRGGLALHPPHHPAHLAVAAYALGVDPERLGATRAAYATSVVCGGPDDVYTVKKALEPHAGSLDLEELLAFLRLCRWDAKVFLDLLPHLLERVVSAPPPLRADARDAVERVWEGWFPIGEPRDLAYGLGRLLCELDDYAGARTYFERSLDLFELDPSRAVALAIATGAAGDVELGRAWLARALELDPEYGPALELRDRLP